MVYLFLTLERSVDAGSFAFPPLTPRKQTHKRKFHIAVFEPLSERNKSSHAPGGKALYKNNVCSLGDPSLAPFHPLITYAPVNLDLRAPRSLFPPSRLLSLLPTVLAESCTVPYSGENVTPAAAVLRGSLETDPLTTLLM